MLTMITQYKRNDVTHICTLITGDRFYIKSDRKKTVYELRMHTMMKVKGQVKKISVCKNDHGETFRFDANRVVVFLIRTAPTRKRTNTDPLARFFHYHKTF